MRKDLVIEELTFYTSQAVMRDGSGNIIQCDDTVKGEFIGFLNQIFNQTVAPTDAIQQNAILGDQIAECITQPVRFMAQIANIVAGQEGQKVYWQFNNQVQFVTGVNGNLAGTIWQVFDATHAWILPAWLNRGIGDFGFTSWMVIAPTVTAVTLTKWDLSRIFEAQSTVPLTITLPPVSLCSPGDSIQFLYTGANLSQVTLAAAAGNTVQGAATFLMGTAQNSRCQVATDGVSKWGVIGL